MTRSLAHIEKILKLDPIEGADKIEKATILGWEVVVMKGRFKEGELIIYVEVDSVLPDKPEFEFMRERKFRVRAIKLRKQISQGMCLPLSTLPKGSYKEGEDVTEKLSIIKYETPTERSEKQITNNKNSKINKFFMKYNWFRRIFASDRMNWPSFIKKTDEERLQNIPKILEYLKGKNCEVTEKLDGQSATYFLIKNNKKWQFWKPYIFGVCSRNFLKGKKDNSTWWRIADKYNIESCLRKEISNNKYIVIQGEIIGESIQGNKYGIKGIDFFLFNVFTDTENNNPSFKEDFCSHHKIKQVPVLETSFTLKDSVNEMVEYSKGNSLLKKDVKREGIVVRNYGIIESSFKVINPEFLLKNEE